MIGGEIGGTKMRKKVLASAGVVNMCSAILVTSVTVSILAASSVNCTDSLQPYLMNVAPGSAGLGARVGWFFAAPSKWTVLTVPNIFTDTSRSSALHIRYLLHSGAQGPLARRD